MRLRSGYMLIEMMAVIAVGAAMFGIATGAIYMLYEAERASRDQFAHSVTVGRLADRFRRDVYAAAEMERDPQTADNPQQPGWILTLPNQRTIQYRAVGRSMIRVESHEGKTVSRESFDLGRHWHALMDRRDEQNTTFISLRLEADHEASSEKFSRSLVIEAILSLDHRHMARK